MDAAALITHLPRMTASELPQPPHPSLGVIFFVEPMAVTCTTQHGFSLCRRCLAILHMLLFWQFYCCTVIIFLFLILVHDPR